MSTLFILDFFVCLFFWTPSFLKPLAHISRATNRRRIKPPPSDPPIRQRALGASQRQPQGRQLPLALLQALPNFWWKRSQATSSPASSPMTISPAASPWQPGPRQLSTKRRTRTGHPWCIGHENSAALEIQYCKGVNSNVRRQLRVFISLILTTSGPCLWELMSRSKEKISN